MSEAYYKADDDYTGRTTVPALIDVQTGKVVNNDYNRLTNYFEVNFREFHGENAPDLYPEELREEIDKLNIWLFHNVNNSVYKTAFARSKEAFWDAYNAFYAALDILEERLGHQRFLFGDYVTDSDVRLYVTLARLDIRYAFQLGHTKSVSLITKTCGDMQEIFTRSRHLRTTRTLKILQILPIKKRDISWRHLMQDF